MHSYRVLERGKPLNMAEKAAILLHGRGASAEDILSLAPKLLNDTFYIAAPQALNNTWYPYTFLAPEEKNEPWLTSAVMIVKRLIDEITSVIPPQRLYIMGFSQGACLSLEVSSRFALKYAGIAAFTGGLIGQSLNPAKYRGNFDETPVFIGNSDSDPHVPLSRSEESKIIMESLGARVTLKIYPSMPHMISKDEIDTVKSMMIYE